MKKFAYYILVLIVVTACGILPSSLPPTAAIPSQPTQPDAADTSAPPPAPTQPPPAETAVTLPELLEKTRHEESASPAYTLDVKYPFLQNSSQSAAFNIIIDGIIQAFTDDFMTQVNENESFRLENIPEVSSGLVIDYKVTLVDENFISLIFSISPYIAGMAHPGLYAHVVNFDMHQGAPLQLADMFLPHADHLTPIAAYCKDELNAQDMFLFPEGADPNDDNYRNRNIFSDGFSINFDPYQVAPWAAGPQQVFIPFARLQGILDSAGPLAPYLQ